MFFLNEGMSKLALLPAYETVEVLRKIMIAYGRLGAYAEAMLEQSSNVLYNVLPDTVGGVLVLLGQLFQRFVLSEL